MTKNQRRMLEVLDWWGGHGTIEAIIQYGEVDSGDDLSESQAWSASQLAAGAVVRSLVKRGWATDDTDGWDITDEGRAALRRVGYKCRPERLAEQHAGAK